MSSLIKVDVISNTVQMQFLSLKNFIDSNLSCFEDIFFPCCVKQIELLVLTVHEISVGM